MKSALVFEDYLERCNMKGLKLAAKSQGYTLGYDSGAQAYKATKEGFKTLYFSKFDLELMPVWKLVHKLQTNDQEIEE